MKALRHANLGKQQILCEKGFIGQPCGFVHNSLYISSAYF